MRTLSAAAVLSTLVTIVACGGSGGGSGGGGGGPPNPPPPPTPVSFTPGPVSTITPSASYMPPHTLTETELCHVDEDGVLDFAWVFATTHTVGPLHDIQAMPGVGDGSFNSGFGGGGYESIISPPMTSGDVLGVGAGGYVFAVENPAGFILTITYGIRTVGMGTAQVGGAGGLSGNLAGLAVGDLNGDLVDDVIVADSAGVRVVAFLSLGETGLNPAQPSALPVGSVPDGLAAGEFTGDAFEDLFVSLGTAGYVVLTSDGTGLFTAGSVVPLGSARFFSDFATGDFDDDGRQDVAGVIEQAGQPNRLGVLLGNGDGTFDPLLPFVLPPDLAGTALVHVKAADLNGDSRADLTFVAPALDRAVVALSDGVGGFVLSDELDLLGGGNATLSLGDVDDDGDLDLLIGNATALTVRVLLNDLL